MLDPNVIEFLLNNPHELERVRSRMYVSETTNETVQKITVKCEKAGCDGQILLGDHWCPICHYNFLIDPFDNLL